jgi:chaperonin GroES
MAKTNQRTKKKPRPVRSGKVQKKSVVKPMFKTGAGLQPLHDGVLIKPETAETTTPSGIIIPDTAKQEKATFGRVIAVGEGRYGDEGDLIPMRVSVGQKVYFNPGWENEVEFGGEKYYLVRESDVKAIVS